MSRPWFEPAGSSGLRRLVDRYLPGHSGKPREQQAFVGHVSTCDLERGRFAVVVERGSLERGQELRLRGPSADAEMEVQAVLLNGREVRKAREGEVATVMTSAITPHSMEPPHEGARVFVLQDVYRRAGAATLERFPLPEQTGNEPYIGPIVPFVYPPA